MIWCSNWADRTYANSLGYTSKFGGGFSATLALDDATERRGTIAGGAYGGVSMPEITGKLNYEASWGQIHAVGMIHQVRATDPRINSVYGLGGSIGTKINLPFLGEGSNLRLSGTITEGANAYTQTMTFSAGKATLALPDATIWGHRLGKHRLGASPAGFRHLSFRQFGLRCRPIMLKSIRQGPTIRFASSSRQGLNQSTHPKVASSTASKDCPGPRR